MCLPAAVGATIGAGRLPLALDFLVAVMVASSAATAAAVAAAAATADGLCVFAPAFLADAEAETSAAATAFAAAKSVEPLLLLEADRHAPARNPRRAGLWTKMPVASKLDFVMADISTKILQPLVLAALAKSHGM